VKAARRRFDSAPSECGRAAIGGMQRRQMDGDGLGVLRKEKGPGWVGARPKGQGGLGRRGNIPRKMVRSSNRVWIKLVNGLQTRF
jgi:hypothetical protein